MKAVARYEEVEGVSICESLGASGNACTPEAGLRVPLKGPIVPLKGI